MKKPIVRKIRCAVYTRKSSEEGLEQEFNSLDAQREACEAYIASQKPEGWVLVPDRYDDGGISGATLERPGLQRLLADIEAHRVDVVVVYKIDRLSRALMDFAKLVESYGHTGMRIEDPSDIEPTLREAFKRKDELVFMDFITDQSENVYPMVPGGKGISEMILAEEL